MLDQRVIGTICISREGKEYTEVVGYALSGNQNVLLDIGVMRGEPIVNGMIKLDVVGSKALELILTSP